MVATRSCWIDLLNLRFSRCQAIQVISTVARTIFDADTKPAQIERFLTTADILLPVVPQSIAPAQAGYPKA